MSYIGIQPALQLFKKSIFTGDGSTTDFDLVDPVTSVNSILVMAGGVVQEPTVSYTIENTPFTVTLSFIEAPADGVEIFVIWLGFPNADEIDLSTFLHVTGSPTAGDLLIFDDPTWIPYTRLEAITLAASDETTALTTGTGKLTFRMPYAFTLTGVRASVTTAPVGSTIIVDINESGTSVLSTKLSIDASEKTSTTAATAAVISDSSLADDAEITIDIDQVGSSTAGAGLKVTLLGTRTV